MKNILVWSCFTVCSVILVSPVIFAEDGSGLGTKVAAETSANEPGTFPNDLAPDLKDIVFRNVLDYAYPSLLVKWTFNPVSVCWENPGNMDAEYRALVRAAVQDSWERYSALKFSYWDKCTADHLGIRIAVEDSGPHTKGLGNQLDGIKNGMVLNFEFGLWGRACGSTEQERRNCIYSIAVHEFGHAIGFAHEQNRPDTPLDVCDEGPQGSDGDTILTPWDPDSVMNYCNPRYNNNGILSGLDRYAVGAVYGAPAR